MSEDRQERFAAYVEALAEVIGHADRVEPLRDYCRGLLLPGERKSGEPIAGGAGGARGGGADRGGDGAGPGLSQAPVAAAFRRQCAVVGRAGSQPDTGID